MAVRPIDGNELVRSLKNRRLHILMENENDGAAVFDDIVDWIKYTPTLTPPNEPLTQEDIDKMHFDRVWIDYGLDDSGERCGEDGVILYGKLYSIDALDGAGLEELLLDAVGHGGDTLDNPSGTYTLYRHLPEGEEET